MNDLPSKICPVCGRRFQWRKKWAADWEQVRFCSKRCKATRLDATDQAIEDTLRRLLRTHPNQAIALSAIAEHLPIDPNTERARNAARRLVARGEAVLVDKGRVIEPEHARGPLWLRGKVLSG